MTGNEIARRPDQLIPMYAAEFAAVLPSHVPADTFIRVAVGALRRDPKLMATAEANPQSLMTTLREAARLGLEPGTPEFWLIPRKIKGVPTVTGFAGWEGLVELIYKGGAVSSVKAELVHVNDEFDYSPASMDRPVHKVDWFGDRGAVLGAYAYAEMVGGGTSRVVVIGPAQIQRAKSASTGAEWADSPWKSDFGAMVLKTAIRQLGKWVPTSAEYRREQLRAATEVAREIPQAPIAVHVTATESAPPTVWADSDGVVVDEAELVANSVDA